ncbi:unknown [Prevotella sp. CAG:487]|nr:unknown [Prevotella sp. CAG:487]
MPQVYSHYVAHRDVSRCWSRCRLASVSLVGYHSVHQSVHVAQSSRGELAARAILHVESVLHSRGQIVKPKRQRHGLSRLYACRQQRVRKAPESALPYLSSPYVELHIALELCPGVVPHSHLSLYEVAIDGARGDVAERHGTYLQAGSVSRRGRRYVHRCVSSRHHVVACTVVCEPHVVCSRLLWSEEEGERCGVSLLQRESRAACLSALVTGLACEEIYLAIELFGVVSERHVKFLLPVHRPVARELYRLYGEVYRACVHFERVRPVSLHVGYDVAVFYVEACLPHVRPRCLAYRHHSVDAFLQSADAEAASVVVVRAQIVSPAGLAYAHERAVLSHITYAVVEAVGLSRPVDVVAEYLVAPYLGVVDGHHSRVVSLHSVRQTQYESLLSHGVAVAARACPDAAVVSGVEYLYAEVAVAAASPSPVEVEKAVSVVSVHHEGVRSSRRRTGESDGMTGGYLVVDKVGPLVQGVVAAVLGVRGVVISEVFCQRLSAVETRSRRRTVAHLDSRSHIHHQLRHGVLLHVGALSVVYVGHVRPVYLRPLGNGGHAYLMSVAVERIARYALHHRVGPLVEVHHLRESRRHASRRAAVALRSVRVVVARAQQIVGVALVPAACHERLYGVAHLLRLHLPGFPFSRLFGHALAVEPVDELQIALQPCHHALRSGSRVELSAVSIAEDSLRAVVARHDDRSPVAAMTYPLSPPALNI